MNECHFTLLLICTFSETPSLCSVQHGYFSHETHIREHTEVTREDDGTLLHFSRALRRVLQMSSWQRGYLHSSWGDQGGLCY